jgi:hypothetical protein
MPECKNYTSENNAFEKSFQFHIDKFPAMSYKVTKVNLPGMEVGEVPVPNAFTPFAEPGETLSINKLQLEFIVDESFFNYFSLVSWMRSITFAEDFEGFTELVEQFSAAGVYDSQNDATFSDAVLNLYTNTMENAGVRVVFKDCWPSSVGDLSFDSQGENGTILVATAEFQFQLYDIEYDSAVYERLFE